MSHLATANLLSSLVYALIGIALMMFGYKVFDIINRLDFTKEIGNNNVAVGVMVAGFFIALSIVIAAAII